MTLLLEENCFKLSYFDVRGFAINVVCMENEEIHYLAVFVFDIIYN